MRKVLTVVVLFLMAFAASSALAQQDAIFAGSSGFTASNNLNIDGTPFFNTDSGWFRNDGLHSAGNTNYITGYCAPDDCGGFNYHGYFSFDLANLVTASSATFNVDSYLIQYDSGTYSIYGTSFAPGDVYSGNSYSDVGIYNALISGPLIGSVFVTPGDSFSTVSVSLNAAGISWLDSHAGSGAVIGADFNGTPTPEPTSLALLGAGIVGMAGAFRRKRS